jgi:hypothetical protein
MAEKEENRNRIDYHAGEITQKFFIGLGTTNADVQLLLLR